MIAAYDVAVFGAGPAGICAALQSARLGLKTALVEKNGICGGTMTFCGINYPGIFGAWGKQIIAGIGWELLTATWKETGAPIPENTMPYMPQKKVDILVFAALTDKALQKAGVDIRFHTMPASARFEHGIWHLQLCEKDGLVPVTAKMVIDCTGDANVAFMAGLPCITRTETQPGTLSMYFHNFDESKLDFGMLEKRFDEAVKRGEVTVEDIGWAKKFSRGFFTGYGGNSNHITGINAADSRGRTQMEIAGRKSILRMYHFLKSCPGLENAEFHLNSGECGVRETRVIRGEYTITVEDYISGKRYKDGICNAFYPIDLHDTECGRKYQMLAEGVVPSIPLRALIPENSENFLVAGRCLSADRLALSGLRVQAPCMAMGQAAGCAAALGCLQNKPIQQLEISDIRDLLRQHKAILPETS